MTIQLQVFGPIDIPCSNHASSSVKNITTVDRDNFMAELAGLDLAKKNGCYVFAMRAGRGFCPWYVGKTNRRLIQECMAPLQITKYNEVLFSGIKGTPVMFFVCPEGKKNKIPNKVCLDIESFLIHQAALENPDLKNSHKVDAQWVIRGAYGTGRGKGSAEDRKFCLMMGL
jgi:hypothetical protein